MGNDHYDVLAGGLFTVSAATSLGIADVTLLNQSLSETLATIGGMGVTYAVFISVLALAGAWIINKPRMAQFSQEQKLLVGGTIAAIAAGVAMPQLTNSISDSIVLALGVLGVEAGGYWSIATEG